MERSMSADNRAVHTDALATLGTIIGEGEARDAIHLAVEPVVASESLWPGCDVGLLPDGTASRHAPPLGIVDPFIKGPVSRVRADMTRLLRRLRVEAHFISPWVWNAAALVAAVLWLAEIVERKP
jgi:hypothetical protein